MRGQSDKLREALETLAVRAGRAILEVQRKGVTAALKTDNTPVTEADKQAEAIILDGLARIAPDIPVIAEEAMATGAKPKPSPVFFLVDALDGTREFIAGRPEYTVNIALVADGIPVTGIVYCPATGDLFSAEDGTAHALRIGAEAAPRRVLSVRQSVSGPIVLASRSHRTPQTDDWIAAQPGSAVSTVGSSKKFCLIAAGEADLYPRFGRTMEWDTAAGDAILRAAGGMTRTLDGAPLRYGKAPDYANPDFIASTRKYSVPEAF